MAEVGRWTGREVLTMTCCSFTRGSTWRSAVYPVGAVVLWGCIKFLPPSRAGTKTLGVLSPFCFLCHSAQCIPSRVTDTSNSNGIPASEMPTTLICFTSIFASQRWLAALIPRPLCALSFFFKCILNLFIYLFLSVLGLRFCARAFSSCGERGPLFIAVRRPLTVAASLVAEHKLQTRRLSSCGSRA